MLKSFKFLDCLRVLKILQTSKFLPGEEKVEKLELKDAENRKTIESEYKKHPNRVSQSR